ncbi:MAG: hypothetical protein A3K03_13115 [Bdellovibrionales bacterium RIFOXYD1_FULL_44_7]|nr:MAG: hypothetical protein A3K03_13115 [Bdellovibrionales bacterium RIFOXYD1_FULL_44_7]
MLIRYYFTINLLTALILCAITSITAKADSVTENSAVIEETSGAVTTKKAFDRYSANYYAILYGPSIGQPGSLQSNSKGVLDPERPIIVKNYISLGYGITENIGISGTGYWMWKPVRGQYMDLRDPYLRLSHNQLLHSEKFNLYADARAHFAVSDVSRSNDLLTGFQSFQITTLQIGDTPIMLGSYTSIRYNVFGSQGIGSDLELYFGPNFNFQIKKNLALSILYEMGASHIFGDDFFSLINDGTDLQPGVLWEVTPNLLLNPYLTLYTGDRVTLTSTSFGMTLSWQLL